jgi:4-nitrophenyl phosphatase
VSHDVEPREAASPRLAGAIVDVDGTVMRGHEVVPGAREGVRALRDAGVDVLFCSNNPTKRPEAYVERLGAHGIAVEPDRVLTAAEVTASFLASEHPDGTVWAVASRGLRDALADHGVATTDDVDAADVVLGSHDHRFDYDDLERSLWALEEAAFFYGSDPDRVIPTADRPMPGSGAIVNAMAGVAERDPDAILGKPHPYTRELALQRLGTAPAATLVVGDRLDTDVALAGDDMRSALVLTGIATREDVAGSEVGPDHVFAALGDVVDLL